MQTDKKSPDPRGQEAPEKVYSPDWKQEFYTEQNIDYTDESSRPEFSPLWIDPEVLRNPQNYPQWQGWRYRRLRQAFRYGHIIPYWDKRDYLIYAVKQGGYETVLIWGVQGGGKSNRLLWDGFQLLQDWDEVLAMLVFTPKELYDLFKKISKHERYAWVGWDDVGVHFPSSTWRTDVEIYQAVDQMWSAIRTNVSTVTLSCPNVDRLSKVLLDNVTIESYIGPNRSETVEKCFRLMSYKKLESMFMKVLVEPTHLFDIYEVPSDLFKQYNERRLTLSEEAVDLFGNVIEADTLDNWIPFLDAVESTKGVISYFNLKDSVTRGEIRKISVGNPKQILVHREDLTRYIQLRTGKNLDDLLVKSTHTTPT